MQAITPNSLLKEIRTEVRKRFRYSLDENFNIGRKLPMLRALCLKIGIQLAAKEYDFESSSTFSPDDIVSVYPIVKCAEPTVGDQRKLFVSIYPIS